MGYLFLIVFQPFGAYTFSNKFKYLLLVPYAVIAFVVYATVNFLFQKQSTSWSVYKELVKIFCILIICSGLNYIYNIYFINHVAFNISHLFMMCLYTFAIAVPVSIIYILGRYIYLTKHWEIAEKVLPETIPDKILKIKAEAGSDILTLQENNFLYAESDGNYITIYYLDKHVLHRQMLRLSLKNLEIQLKTDGIIRCHRSFIVNISKIKKVKGNAQGYKLFIAGVESIVPVSRTYISKLQKYLSEV